LTGVGKRTQSVLHVCVTQINNRVETLDLEENALGGKGTAYIADMLRENGFITGLVRTE